MKWTDKETRLQTEITEAGKKHEQLVNRTALVKYHFAFEQVCCD